MSKRKRRAEYPNEIYIERLGIRLARWGPERWRVNGQKVPNIKRHGVEGGVVTLITRTQQRYTLTAEEWAQAHTLLLSRKDPAVAAARAEVKKTYYRNPKPKRGKAEQAIRQWIDAHMAEYINWGAAHAADVLLDVEDCAEACAEALDLIEPPYDLVAEMGQREGHVRDLGEDGSVPDGPAPDGATTLTTLIFDPPLARSDWQQFAIQHDLEWSDEAPTSFVSPDDVIVMFGPLIASQIPETSREVHIITWHGDDNLDKATQLVQAMLNAWPQSAWWGTSPRIPVGMSIDLKQSHPLQMSRLRVDDERAPDLSAAGLDSEYAKEREQWGYDDEN